MLYAGRNKQMAEPERIEANWIADVRADESTLSGLIAVFNSECPTENPARFSQSITAS